MLHKISWVIAMVYIQIFIILVSGHSKHRAPEDTTALVHYRLYQKNDTARWPVKELNI